MNIRRCLCGLALIFISIGVARTADAADVPPALRGVKVREQLGNTIDRKLTFTDQFDNRVALRSYFDGHAPVLLTLNYFHCPTLCDIQLSHLAYDLREWVGQGGHGLRVLSISIDPNDTAMTARQKRNVFLRKAGPGIDWSFLVASNANAHAIAKELGLTYKYDKKSGQYAHIPVFFFLAPDGRVVRYLYGLDINPRDFRLAVLESSAGRIGQTVDRVLLSCFQYDPATGKYSMYVLGLVRMGGALTLLLMGVFAFVLHRRARKHARERAR